MKYCNSCKIKYNTPLEKCLFCNNELVNLDQQIMKHHYPSFEKEKQTSRYFMKLVTFFLAIANITCSIIDLAFNPKPGLSWSWYVLISSIYLLLLLDNVIFNRRWIEKIYYFSLLTILFLLAIGFASGNYHWAVDYILPLGILSCSVLLSCFLFKKSKIYDYTIYLLLFNCFGFLPTILLLTNNVKDIWPSMACSLYSLFALLTLFVFRPGDTVRELKRRFHV